MQTKRIFIAVDISDEGRKKVTAYIDELRETFPKLRVGWERPEKLHITLKFLGEVDDERLELIQDAVKVVAGKFDKFPAEIYETGVFPNVRNPKVLWLGLSKNEKLMSEIAEKLETTLESQGFIAERRKFSPHLTIARLREPQRSLELAKLHQANNFEPVGFEVREIVNYESKLLPAGSVYSKLAAFPLREAG